MKQIVVEAIESDVLLRRGQNLHAKYYAVITLNQTVLSAKEAPLAKKLLEIYFGLFKVLLRGDSEQPNKEAPPKDQKMNRKAIKRQKEKEEAEQTEEEMTEKMLAQILTGINRSFPFADLKTEAFDAQLDTLYRITHSSNFNTSVQALILIQMIIQTKDIAADRFYRTLYESLLDPRLVTSSKQVMYLNLLYKSMKADVSAKRVQAFVKRLLQILSIHDPPFVCSALYLVSEVGKSFPAIHSMASDPEQLDDDTDQNGTEVYDPRKRDPLYSHADKSCLWELLPLESHFHPSVSLFANRLLFGGQTPPKPDPTLHTLMHFLDRFVYRNAKTSGPALRGNSIMQPLAGSKVADLLITERSGARKEMPLNTEEFWSKDVKDVAADEVFFHRYFARAGPKATKTKTKKIKKKDSEDEGEDEDEDDIWKALVQSRPNIEGEDDEDLSDLAELMSDDDEDEPDEDELGEESEVEINLDSDGPDSQDGSDAGDNNGSDSDAGFGLDALESDDDAMRDSEDEVPDEIAVPEPKAENAKTDGKKKRKLKSLPLFASVDDYASLLQDEEDY
jgi:ribosome biogenesis protein MAK21